LTRRKESDWRDHDFVEAARFGKGDNGNQQVPYNQDRAARGGDSTGPPRLGRREETATSEGRRGAQLVAAVDRLLG